MPVISALTGEDTSYDPYSVGVKPHAFISTFPDAISICHRNFKEFLLLGQKPTIMIHSVYFIKTPFIKTTFK